MSLAVYNLLLIVLSPLLLLYLLYRRSIGKEDAAHWHERWGRMPESFRTHPGKPRIWVHAVSVGEVMAAAPVLRELRKRWPDAALLLTTTTPGGREVALRQCPPADSVAYYPLDFRPAVGRALAAARPDAVLLLEWEIWPNFLTAARRRGARIAVLNGRISDRGLRRGSRAGFFTAPALAAVDRFAMQSAEDARRAVAVGAAPERVATLGNTKFDEFATPLTEAERAALRVDLGIPPHAPVWVCGSTRPGEETILAQAFQAARQTLPDLRLIVAPRHLERAGEAAAAFKTLGIVVRRRSAPAAQAPQAVSTAAPPILLLDSFGELGRVYAVAQVAFVGGSLLPFGGQSVFQPLAQGVPTVFGPHMNNQRDIAALAIAEGVGFQAPDAQVLLQEVIRLVQLTDAERAALARKARALIERNQGIAARCVDLVETLLNETTHA